MLQHRGLGGQVAWPLTSVENVTAFTARPSTAGTR